MEDTTQFVTLRTRFRDMLTSHILRSTLKKFNPVVQEIKQYNEHLNPSGEDTKEKEAGEELACKCNCIHLCMDRIGHRDDNQALTTLRDVQETLYKVRETLEVLYFEEMLKGPMERPFGVPENTEFSVGLDEHLSKLKMELLRDGSSTLVLTGLGGSGKTTLATKLCWDAQIKGKFKENVLFVTFSKTPKLKIIVERLFEHCGYPVPHLQSDEDVANKLGLLLRKIEGSPLLLVLDDVWPSSEFLIEKFQYPISADYKILVTSRVAFPTLGTTCILKPLDHEDATTLFYHYSQLQKSYSNILDDDLLQKVVGSCKGLPLAIKVIATSLRNRPYEVWQKIMRELSQGHSILDSNTKILNVLEDNPITKECFMDLALFPEDQRIPVAALIDMWAESYGLDDDGIEAMDIINKLESMNLANLFITRKDASATDNYYYNNHFIILHDLLRDLGIYQSTKEPIKKRKRLIIETNDNTNGSWLGEKQQSMMSLLLSKYITCVKQNPQKVPARTLSISIDDSCASDWSQMQTAKAEVLILNLRTNQFFFPESLKKMSKLKVLLVTNHGFHPSELSNFELLDSLLNLKRIRLERVSVPSFSMLKNLKKLSLYMCGTRQAFEKGSILISNAFPNLVELGIDYCKDMVSLPNGVCDITTLRKLSITNCHNLCTLPQEIGKLENLELLRLISCTDLEGIPVSIGRLLKLKLLDISNCISISYLPEEIGNLCNLINLYMTSCASCELPFSVANLQNLKVITCDEETAASWEAFQHMMPNVKIEIPHVDVNLNWLG